jgi:hypothetical protein
MTRDREDTRMADPPRYPHSDADTGDRGSATGTPRWAVVLGIVIAIVLVLLVIVLHLTGTLGPGAH